MTYEHDSLRNRQHFHHWMPKDLPHWRHTDATMTGVQHSVHRHPNPSCFDTDFEKSPTLRYIVTSAAKSNYTRGYRRRARSFKYPCVCDIRYRRERTGCIVCRLDYDSSFTQPSLLAAVLLEKVPGSAMENKRVTIVYLLSCIIAAALQTGQSKF